MTQNLQGIPFPELDPVAFSLFGLLHIRWYALAYLIGFLGGWGYGRWLSSQFSTGFRPNKDDIEDLLPWVVLGVIVGGRLGYVLFYNFSFYMQNPLRIPFIWEGGMSFHGGLAGVITVMALFAYCQKIVFLSLADLVACLVPIGLFFGRIANFINAELYGRITTVSWGIVFPNAGPYPRHPSQIYEALSEGMLLFIVLYILARFFAAWKTPGVLSGAFLTGYGLCRFCIEWVREPDPQLGLFADYFSMGQLLSLPMIVGGALLMRYAVRKGDTTHAAQKQ